jgi:hypothetical protein
MCGHDLILEAEERAAHWHEVALRIAKLYAEECGLDAELLVMQMSGIVVDKTKKDGETDVP